MDTGMNLVPMSFFLLKPSVATKGILAFAPQPRVLNEASLFRALLPSSSAHLGGKVKLPCQRTGFS